MKKYRMELKFVLQLVVLTIIALALASLINT